MIKNSLKILLWLGDFKYSMNSLPEFTKKIKFNLKILVIFCSK